MIYAREKVVARWDGKVIEISPDSPLDFKKYGYAEKQISSIEQHIINKYGKGGKLSVNKPKEEKKEKEPKKDK